MAKKDKEIPEEVKILLKTVVDHFTEEDKAVRETQIRQWRKLNYIGLDSQEFGIQKLHTTGRFGTKPH